MSHQELENQTRRLAQDFLGRDLLKIGSATEALQAIGNGEVFLIFAQHQLVALSESEGRITFFNPAASQEPTGTVLPEGDLPARRVEEDFGEESLSVTDLELWMAQDRMRAFKLS